ncbi:MAG TPA: RICIN domain-containing protein [Myxococcota bacterium]|nr:RICIN domain-containing protein [Myxococcota bacterium]
MRTTYLLLAVASTVACGEDPGALDDTAFTYGIATPGHRSDTGMADTSTVPNRAPPPAQVRFTVTSEALPGQCLSAPATGTVVARTCDGSADQRWSLVEESLRVGDKCLSTQAPGTPASGMGLTLADCDVTPGKRWTFTTGSIQNAADRNIVLSLRDPAAGAAQATVTAPFNYPDLKQRWRMNYTTATQSGGFKVSAANDPNTCLLAIGTVVGAGRCDTVPTTLWQTNVDGLWVNGEGMCLDTEVPNSQVTLGTRVVTRACNDAPSQWWSVEGQQIAYDTDLYINLQPPNAAGFAPAVIGSNRVQWVFGSP